MLQPVNKHIAASEITTDHIRKFFDERIAELEDDKKKMLLGISHDEKTEMYERLIKRDFEVIVNQFWEAQTLNILGDMFANYIDKLLSFEKKPEKLAFKFSLNSISAFMVINDNDKELINHIILTEASVIPEYAEKGFSIDSIYFEKGDEVGIPENYDEFDIELNWKKI